jgi:hypothetical protein
VQVRFTTEEQGPELKNWRAELALQVMLANLAHATADHSIDDISICNRRYVVSISTLSGAPFIRRPTVRAMNQPLAQVSRESSPIEDVSGTGATVPVIEKESSGVVMKDVPGTAKGELT